jgi:hypothetical protein
VPGALAQTTDEIIERALAAAPRQMSGLAAAPRQMKEECERIGTTNGLCVPRVLCGC